LDESALFPILLILFFPLRLKGKDEGQIGTSANKINLKGMRISGSVAGLRKNVRRVEIE
jgi:hypothetical protein